MSKSTSFIGKAIDRSRTVLLILCSILVAGIYTYITIAKESKPDIKIPFINVTVYHEGISPEDSERLIVRPLERELQKLEGVKKMSSRSYLSGGQVGIEFVAGFDSDKARADVRDKIDIAKAELPAESDEPVIKEVNLSQFPVLVVKLSGDIPNRTLYKIAEDLKEEVESNVSEVLKATVVGNQEEVVEIIVDPKRIEGYRLSASEVGNFFQTNNVMVSAGNLQSSRGEFSVKVPGVIETVHDLLGLPIAQRNGTVVTLSDIADIKRTFKDPTNFARDAGKPSVAVEVSKRTGENIIETVQKVREVVAEQRSFWPSQVQVQFAQDDSSRIQEMLSDLENQILSAVLLVMIVIIAALGFRSALLVGIAVPGAFLAGLLIIGLLGYTLNIVVLFSLILSIGMLVDGAIIVVEFADRKMVEGYSKEDAYKMASKRMLWPVMSSVGTIIVVFMPLFFWPGIVGEFMKFLPLTLVATLSASLLMALVFIPVLGSLFGKIDASHIKENDSIVAMESGDLNKVTGFSRKYLDLLDKALDHPTKIVGGSVAVLVGIIMTFALFGRGVEFFPDIDPDTVVLFVHERGNLSLDEKDKIVRRVENRVLDMNEFSSIYTRVGRLPGSQEAEDVIGKITFEFVNWQKRRKVNPILDEVMERTKDIPGVYIEVQKNKPGPATGKAVQLELASHDYPMLLKSTKAVRSMMERMPGLKDIEDNTPLAGIEWQLEVDREQAARFGTNIQEIGSFVRLVTNGFKAGEYRPDDATDEVDFIIRYPAKYRNIAQLDKIRVTTPLGMVPISNFVERTAKPRVTTIYRTDGEKAFTLKAEVQAGVLADDKVKEISQWLKENPLDKAVKYKFRGESEDQAEAGKFLLGAFTIAVFLIITILVTQFNSFFSMWLIVSSIVMSTIGVFLFLIVTNEPFGIVMGGIGVIALAGIIVSNNIILIDTFDQIYKDFKDKREVVLRTGVQRLRPVLLTQITTVLGLLPIMFGVSINFFEPSVTIGAPSTKWWIQLSSSIVSGVLFASVLTLFVTPSALMMRENWRAAKKEEAGQNE